MSDLLKSNLEKKGVAARSFFFFFFLVLLKELLDFSSSASGDFRYMHLTLYMHLTERGKGVYVGLGLNTGLLKDLGHDQILITALIFHNL